MLRSLRILALCALAGLGSPTTSQACCLGDWLFGRSCNTCNYGNPCCGQTTYRPLFPSFGFYRASYGGDGCNSCCSPCSSCSPCNSCCTQYVPQTTYRACCVSVPVTTCRPVCATDPCTGCPVTVMRPVTSFVQQVRYTPVVTYRPVCPTPCCSPCGDACGSSCGSCGSAAVGYAPAGSCCGGGVTTVAPATVAPAMVPSTVPTTVAPALPDGTPVPQTYREGAGYYRPAPVAPAVPYNTNYRGENPPPPPRPALTTQLPQRTWTFRPVSTPVEQQKSVEAQDDGWRAAKR